MYFTNRTHPEIPPRPVLDKSAFTWMASWTWRLIGDFSMSNSRNTSKCGTRAVYLANASPSAHTKQAGEVGFHRVRRGFVMIRTEAMGASIEWLDFARYEWNMGDANVGPPSLARCIASLLCRHLKCMLSECARTSGDRRMVKDRKRTLRPETASYSLMVFSSCRGAPLRYEQTEGEGNLIL